MFPAVWAAIYGCEGPTKMWHYESNYRGGRDVVFGCATCRAAKAHTSSLAGSAYQDALHAAQRAANVSDYRTARTAWVNGRPVIVHTVAS